MPYRAHLYVHNQLPSDEMSCSLNTMEASPRQPCLSQYRFDVKRCEIAGILTATSTEALLKIAAHHGDGNAHDLVRSFAAHHPCDRIQMTAIQALAAAEPTYDDRLSGLGRASVASGKGETVRGESGGRRC